MNISRLNRIGRQLQPVELAAGELAVNWQTTSACSDEGLTLETSAFESLYGGQFTLSTQLIYKTRLSCYSPHRRSTTVSLETYSLYSLLNGLI